MEENIKIKKEKIKDFAIIFLVVMLVLTLFSNTIMNRSLVQVSTENLQSMTLSTRVRASGTVTSEDTYSVELDGDAGSSRKIEKLMVHKGDKVNVGDLLFTVEKYDTDSIDNAEDAVEDAIFAYNQAVLASGITSAQRFLAEKNNLESLTDMQDALTVAKEAVERLKKTKQDVTLSKTWYDAHYDYFLDEDDQEDKKKDKKRYDASYSIQQTELDNEIADAQSYYDKLLNIYNKQLDLRQELVKIGRLNEKVDNLKKDKFKTEYTANIAGTVSEILISAGKKGSVGDVVMTIEPEKAKMTMVVTIKSRNASAIHTNDPVNIVNNWSSKNISGKVTKIKKNPKEKDSYEVTVELEGDVYAGDNLTISIGESKGSYDAVVSTSSIREDSNGKYVLAIEVKSTPLGNRYYARRVNVEVIASDDNYSAVTGGFNDLNYIITTTSKPIKVDDQVRLAD